MRTRRLGQRIRAYRKCARGGSSPDLLHGEGVEIIIELIAELDAARLKHLESECDRAYSSYAMIRAQYALERDKRTLGAKSVKKTRDILHADYVTLAIQIRELKKAQIVTRRSKRNVRN